MINIEDSIAILALAYVDGSEHVILQRSRDGSRLGEGYSITDDRFATSFVLAEYRVRNADVIAPDCDSVEEVALASVIYGAGGFGHYGVRWNGDILISRMRATDEALKRAAQVGMEEY